ncbi:MAG: His-Xaa-Ser system protein HxsD [Candidatus Acidiferrales bacterium]
MNSADGFGFEVDSETSAAIHLNPRVYSREAILRACYWFTDVAYIRIPESPEDRLVVRVEMKQTAPTLANPNPSPVRQLISEFCNSLLDFELRRQIESETAPVRQLILAKAFSESGVLEGDPPGSIADPVESTQPSSLVQIMNPAPSSPK